jgi:hypothetical protein
VKSEHLGKPGHKAETLWVSEGLLLTQMVPWSQQQQTPISPCSCSSTPGQTAWWAETGLDWRGQPKYGKILQSTNTCWLTIGTHALKTAPSEREMLNLPLATSSTPSILLTEIPCGQRNMESILLCSRMLSSSHENTYTSWSSPRMVLSMHFLTTVIAVYGSHCSPLPTTI